MGLSNISLIVLLPKDRPSGTYVSLNIRILLFLYRWKPLKKLFMKNKKKEFHAVEFMREVREKLSKLYLTDRKKYFAELDKATKEFEKSRKKVQHAA